jgi:hypothetical protein
MFSAKGKGGVIEIIGEPLFPLKTTIEYILNQYKDKKLIVTKALQTGTNFKSSNLKILQVSTQDSKEKDFSDLNTITKIEVLVQGFCEDR